MRSAFTPVYDARGWVEYLPGKYEACNGLDESACVAMAYELQANPELGQGEAPLEVEVTEGVLDYGKYILFAGASLLALAAFSRG